MPSGDELRDQTTRIYDALQLVARAAGSIRGRKILIFFGRGIGEIDSFGAWRPDPRFFQPTVEILNDNNVAVYPLDLTPRASRHSLENSLNALALETGGEFFRFGSSFTTLLDQISDSNGGYYLLSYRSRHPSGASGYQNVKVKVSNPNLQIRSRQGYRYGE